VKEALVILPGITADALKQAAVRDFFSAHTDFDVFLPPLRQGFGIDWCARRLQRFLDREVPSEKYGRVHFLNYISGGFILRRMARLRPFERWGRLVYVRSPIQEQVPFRLVEKYGKVVLFLARGKMMLDLVSDRRNRAPYPDTGQPQGVVLEKGVSKLAAGLGLEAGDFDRYRDEAGFTVPEGATIISAEESHDEIYTSEHILERISEFLKTGRFA